MSKALAALIDNHHLEKIDKNLFRGVTRKPADNRVYGGQMLAQAMNAAQQTVSKRFVLHSFHSYFMRPGEPETPIIYEVDRIRDGRAFTTRRVVAIQNGEAIFNMSLSFQIFEEGFDHQATMPDVPGPKGLPSDRERMHDFLQQQGKAEYDWPIEFRQVDPVSLTKPDKAAAYACIWFKADGQLADDLGQHQELLAYASDDPILVTALRPHAISYMSDEVQVASIDHALWFHRPFRVDEWLLYEVTSNSASFGRGFSNGSIFNQAGDLVASVAQEGLIRHRPHSPAE
ncbi:MAG: acyl-CoA thioesterase [Pseudomonadales bacterium]